MLMADSKLLVNLVREYLTCRCLQLTMFLVPPTRWGARFTRHVAVWAEDEIRRVEEGDE